MSEQQLSVDDPWPADADNEFEAEMAFNRAVNDQARQLRIRDAAQRVVKRERTGGHAQPYPVNLDDFLQVPDADTTYRIDELWPMGGRAVLAAQYKAGKSTLVGNVLRALADGTPFLDTWETVPAQKVVLIDNELDERTLRRWLRSQHIVNESAVKVIPIRGKVSSLDLLDDATRSEWAAMISGADVVILDCLRPVLDALGLDENRDAGRFLVAFDAMLNEAGASEAMIVHHMGHAGERSRGDSRILDWPDATWKLVREDPENPASPRYYSAFGRDVEVIESKLAYDQDTRRLSIAGGTRKDSKADEAIPEILDLLSQHDGLSGREVERHLADSDLTQQQIRSGLKRAHRQKKTITYTGPSRATMHSIRADIAQ